MEWYREEEVRSAHHVGIPVLSSMGMRSGSELAPVRTGSREADVRWLTLCYPNLFLIARGTAGLIPIL